jgi:uncharacterized protein with GYD domain
LGGEGSAGPASEGRTEAVPFYLFEVAYTPEAFKAMIASPSDRKAVADKAISAAGGKLHQFFFAFGKYDVVLIAEYPDDKAATAAAMAVAASGALSSGKTTKLLTTEEAMEAMKSAGKVAAAYRPPTA